MAGAKELRVAVDQAVDKLPVMPERVGAIEPASIALALGITGLRGPYLESWRLHDVATLAQINSVRLADGLRLDPSGRAVSRLATVLWAHTERHVDCAPPARDQQARLERLSQMLADRVMSLDGHVRKPGLGDFIWINLPTKEEHDEALALSRDLSQLRRSIEDLDVDTRFAIELETEYSGIIERLAADLATFSAVVQRVADQTKGAPSKVKPGVAAKYQETFVTEFSARIFEVLCGRPAPASALGPFERLLADVFAAAGLDGDAGYYAKQRARCPETLSTLLAAAAQGVNSGGKVRIHT